MSFLKSRLFIQLILSILAIAAKYNFLYDACRMFPETDFFYYILFFFIILTILIEIRYSIKYKDWKWLYVVIPIPFIMLISAKMESMRDEQEKIPFHQSVSFVINNNAGLEVSNIDKFFLELKDNQYMIVNRGEECRCEYKGTFSFHNDTLLFDKNLQEQTLGLISGNFIYLGDYYIHKSTDYNKAFELESKRFGRTSFSMQ